MPTPLPQKPVVRRKNRQRNQMLITLGVVGLLAVVLLVVVLLADSTEAPSTADAPQPEAATPPESTEQAATPEPEPTGPLLVEDDGRTLWVSPTDGDAISLDYLPPGCDLILHLRPADWLNADEGRESLAALGPQGATLVDRLESLIGMELAAVDELLVGVRGASDQQMETALVVAPRKPPAVMSGNAEPPARFRTARTAEHEGHSYRVGSPFCFFAPPSEEGSRFVIAPRSVLHEILEAGGAAPPLRRELETLATAADRDRHATLLVAPSFLFTDGRALFSDVTDSLQAPTFEFLPDELRAGSLSLHWGHDFYLEARGAAARELTATRLAALLDKRMRQWASALQMAVLDLNPAPHGRRVVAQLPAMTRLLAEQTRFGVVDGAAVLNGYLPLPAGKNLLAASELMLAQLSAGGVGQGGTIATAAPPTAGIAAKLRRRANVSFARDTLEMAVRYLANEIDAPIVILGGDLQLEGITKNQSFGMDATDKPAGHILLEILLKANPDKTATGPADAKQKLVYVVKPGDNGEETLYVTTRAAATKRGDDLPRVFVP